MTNREAMELVLQEATKQVLSGMELREHNEKVEEAIFQMEDYMNDLMREEPTGCDYGIGG